MKRAGQLWSEVVAFENLLRAYRKARRGKRNRAAVAAFSLNLENQLVGLQRELTLFSFRPGPFTQFEIRDPKPRLISAAPFRDRVVHHALCNVIEPIFERRFIEDSYACRKGRGTHRAIRRGQHFMQRHAYVLQCDVRQFFPSIDHRVLLGQVERVIKDRGVLWLVRTIVAHGRSRGLPIGNQTSQFLGNVMLDPLDHFVKDRLGVSGYVRYVDDFLAFADHRADLKRLRVAVERFLSERGLMLHPRKTGIHRCTAGVDFLGTRLWPYGRRLRASSVRRTRLRFRRIVADYAAGRLDPEQATARVAAWVAHARYAETVGLRVSLLGRLVLRVKNGERQRHCGRRCSTLSAQRRTSAQVRR